MGRSTSSSAGRAVGRSGLRGGADLDMTPLLPVATGIANVVEAPAAPTQRPGEREAGMSTRGISIWFAGVVAIAALVAPSALAAKPTIERINIDDTFDDGFLTE